MRKSLAEVTQRSLLLALLVVSTLTLASAERRERTVDTWRPTHYDVSLTLDDGLTELTRAETKITVQVIKGPLKAIVLDFGQMTVDAVRVGNAPVRFEQAGGHLNIQLSRAVNKNDVLTIAVSYHGRPPDGLILTTDKAGKPSATGDNWPDRVHHWIPCLDHPSAKATVNFTVTAPARDQVVANGQLTATRNNADTTRTWTYTEARPIPPYCMIIAVGEYAQAAPTVNNVPALSYYAPLTDRESVVRGFSSAPSALQFFSERVAPFPYEKLALIVGATRFGGMENSSAIVFAGNLLTTPVDAPPLSRRFNIRRGLMEVTAHEIAHQWFGDSVSVKTWADLWLSEGFADYFAGLFTERFDGKEAFRDYMRREAEKYFSYEKGRRAPIYDTETEDLFKLLNPNSYEKGAWVLHMLRGLMGDAAFFRGIRAYYLEHAHRTAATDDLRVALERASGMNLKEFFARWVYGSGHPRYEASWAWRNLRRARGMLVINLRQTQEDAPFLTPLPVEITSAGGTKRMTIRPTGRDSSIRIPLSGRPSDVRIDPDETILRELVVRQANTQAASLRRNSTQFKRSLSISR